MTKISCQKQKNITLNRYDREKGYIMTIKDIAKNVINFLPPKATMDDIIHALYVHAKFKHGEEEIKQKKGVTHEKAKKRLRKWVK